MAKLERDESLEGLARALGLRPRPRPRVLEKPPDLRPRYHWVTMSISVHETLPGEVPLGWGCSDCDFRLGADLALFQALGAYGPHNAEQHDHQAHLEKRVKAQMPIESK